MSAAKSVVIMKELLHCLMMERALPVASSEEEVDSSLVRKGDSDMSPLCLAVKLMVDSWHCSSWVNRLHAANV